MTTITSLPTPPSRQDTTNFNDRADAFLGALPTFATETNAVASEVNAASANAVASSNAAIAATNITKWVSGTTYAQGAVVWSPINGLGYRRITASGSGTTDPSLDTTNYKQVNGTGDVSTSGNQTISGVKTFSSGIALGVDLPIADGGTGAGTALAAFDNLKQSATNAYSGTVILATTAEAISGTDTSKAITPGTMRDAFNATGSAPVYAARAWVNFNGTGTVGTNQTIRASGNVASVYKNATGDYTVNFTTALPDANYAVTGSVERAAGGYTATVSINPATAPTASGVRLIVGSENLTNDRTYINIVIFR